MSQSMNASCCSVLEEMDALRSFFYLVDPKELTGSRLDFVMVSGNNGRACSATLTMLRDNQRTSRSVPFRASSYSSILEAAVAKSTWGEHLSC